jgi:hypothetical protein
LWVVMGTDGSIGYSAYDESGSTTYRAYPPPAIGSSCGKTDAGGKGPVEF